MNTALNTHCEFIVKKKQWGLISLLMQPINKRKLNKKPCILSLRSTAVDWSSFYFRAKF